MRLTIEFMRVGLLSDTHGFLDDAIYRHFAECDEIWHGGDFGTVEVLDQLSAFKPVKGVYGNVDGAELRAALPAELAWECEGLSVYMTHIGGYPGNYDRKAGQALRRLRPGLFLCGHSHILKVMRDQTLGLVHMNTFSPQDRIGQLTMRHLDITDAREKLLLYMKTGLIGPAGGGGMGLLSEPKE